jgi:hypothetical protein
MPEPTLNDIHVDSALTDFSLAYFQEEGKYMAPQVFPIVNVAKRSDKYFTYDRNELLRSDAKKRAPNTESSVRGYKLSTDNYSCEVFSIAVDVSEQERANADPALDPEADAARVTTQDIRTRMDREWTNTAFSTGIWGTESTGTWNSSTGDPVGDIQTGILSVLEDTGYRPNTLVLGAESWYSGLWSSTQIIDRLPDNAPRIVTEGFVANLFGFDRVFVLDSVEFTGDEGTTGTPGFIHEDHALLAYVNPSAGLREATAGKTFVWSGLVGGGGGIRTKRLEMPWKDAMPRVETDAAFDFKIVATDLGYMVKNTVS